MPAVNAHPDARVTTRLETGRLLVRLGGSWRLTRPRPRWPGADLAGSPQSVCLETDTDVAWDSSLILFLFDVKTWCEARDLACDDSALPPGMRHLLEQMTRSHGSTQAGDRKENLLVGVGLAALDVGRKMSEFSAFIGENVLSLLRVLRHPRKFRWRDCLEEMQQCGAMALPIVSLISFLVGLTLAYTAALILRQYGGDIYVADLVGISMVREMGALMTGIVLAGRTGAAYAAQLGNMKANEEIDAFVSLGVDPVSFLALPRLLALAVMMPLLTLYADGMGILGGMLIAKLQLAIPPAAYWVELGTAINMTDVTVGLIKAVTFGLIVGLAGCLRGLQADRSAAGVGQAATSAVVTAILFIIVADALYAVVFNILGL